MPYRILVSQKLAKLFGALSHPARIRIIAELRDGELCVNSLQEKLGISHSAVSQHLALLRSHNLIKERRVSRHVFYRLSSPAMTEWLVDGIQFILPDENDSEALRSAVERARDAWSHSADDPENAKSAINGI